MTKDDDWKAVLIDGVVYEKRADGTLAPAPDRMDWDRIDAMSEDDIARFMSEDEEAANLSDQDWAEAIEDRRQRLEKNSPTLKRA